MQPEEDHPPALRDLWGHQWHGKLAVDGDMQWHCMAVDIGGNGQKLTRVSLDMWEKWFIADQAQFGYAKTVVQD